MSIAKTVVVHDQDCCQDDPQLSLTPTQDFVDRGHLDGAHLFNIYYTWIDTAAQ